jgi:hypothetical protein
MTQQTTSKPAANGGPDSPERYQAGSPSLGLLGPITGMRRLAWLTQIIPATSPFSIVEGVAAE